MPATVDTMIPLKTTSASNNSSGESAVMVESAGSTSPADNSGWNLQRLAAHLMCSLCQGYLVDATTVVECLHTFCRSCILRHLELSSYCPMITCNVMIHRTKTGSSLRSDAILQNIVYKTVPDLYQTEMQRRRVFYSQHPHITDSHLSTSDHGLDDVTSTSLRFYSPYQHVDLRVQYASVDCGELVPVRYLRCTASLPISVLKRFLVQKYQFNEPGITMDIIHGRKILPNDIRLIDVCYLVRWNKKYLKLIFRLTRESLPSDAKRHCDDAVGHAGIPKKIARLQGAHVADDISSKKHKHKRQRRERNEFKLKQQKRRYSLQNDMALSPAAPQDVGASKRSITWSMSAPSTLSFKAPAAGQAEARSKGREAHETPTRAGPMRGRQVQHVPGVDQSSGKASGSSASGSATSQSSSGNRGPVACAANFTSHSRLAGHKVVLSSCNASASMAGVKSVPYARVSRAGQTSRRTVRVAHPVRSYAVTMCTQKRSGICPPTCVSGNSKPIGLTTSGDKTSSARSSVCMHASKVKEGGLSSYGKVSNVASNVSSLPPSVSLQSVSLPLPTNGQQSPRFSLKSQQSHRSLLRPSVVQSITKSLPMTSSSLSAVTRISTGVQSVLTCATSLCTGVPTSCRAVSSASNIGGKKLAGSSTKIDSIVNSLAYKRQLGLSYSAGVGSVTWCQPRSVSAASSTDTTSTHHQLSFAGSAGSGSLLLATPLHVRTADDDARPLLSSLPTSSAGSVVSGGVVFGGKPQRPRSRGGSHSVRSIPNPSLLLQRSCSMLTQISNGGAASDGGERTATNKASPIAGTTAQPDVARTPLSLAASACCTSLSSPVVAVAAASTTSTSLHCSSAAAGSAADIGSLQRQLSEAGTTITLTATAAASQHAEPTVESREARDHVVSR